MAKKRVKPPAVPPGERKAFFDTLQAMAAAEDRSTGDVGAEIDKSHQAVWKAMTGPKMPSRQITRSIVEALNGDTEAVLRMWQNGVAEQHAETERVTPKDTAPQANSKTPRGGIAIREPDTSTERDRRPVETDAGPDARAAAHEDQLRPAKQSEDSPLPGLSLRETQVLLAWMRSDSKREAARELWLSEGTVNTHLARIREKYDRVGRPASTKAALVARALQDGTITLDEL